MNNIEKVIWKSGFRKGFIADKMGLVQSNISNWISGERVPSKSNIRKLCKILNCKVKDLFPDGIKKEKNESNN
tara:strand:- start:1091 stop:1309 length:219 start_codon:yes stop_codon:yes gene_type:complete